MSIDPGFLKPMTREAKKHKMKIDIKHGMFVPWYEEIFIKLQRKLKTYGLWKL